VTALAASHCFRVVSYTAVISRPKALVAGEGYHVVATDASANRMARQREGDREVFFWGGGRHALALPAM